MQSKTISPSYHGSHDAMCFTNAGDLIVGSSNLTGRYWTGCISYYPASQLDPPPSAPTSVAALFTAAAELSVTVSSGINDVKWIRDTKKFITACDNGAVQLYEQSDIGNDLTCQADVTCHSHIVSSCHISNSATRFLTSSYDYSVRIWDLAEFRSLNKFTGHRSPVLSVSGHPHISEVFISCSQDGEIVLWDTRKNRPAAFIHEAGGKSITTATTLPTCVQWRPTSENCFVVGTEEGQIKFHDIRGNISESLLVITPHSRGIRRLLFSPNNIDWLASASNDCTVAVTEYKQGDTTANIVYVDSTSHTDYVQDVSWHPVHPSTLYSCSWDSTVRSRFIQTFPPAQNSCAATVHLEAAAGDGNNITPAAELVNGTAA